MSPECTSTFAFRVILKIARDYLRNIQTFSSNPDSLLRRLFVWCFRGKYPCWLQEKIETCSIWTIVQMLDVITSFNCNCYSPMMVVVWICFIHVLPLRGRWNQSGHIVPLLWQRITCIPTIDISRSDVTPALSRASLRCDVTFSQPSTPCSSETKDVITSKWENSTNQNTVCKM
jgi:hypothetical protein